MFASQAKEWSGGNRGEELEKSPKDRDIQPTGKDKRPWVLEYLLMLQLLVSYMAWSKLFHFCRSSTLRRPNDNEGLFDEVSIHFCIAIIRLP